MRFATAPPLLLAGAASFFASTACTHPEPELQLGRPPVVLIVLDALDGSHVSHLGYERETTPVLDALASEGFSFEAAVAPAPYTLASIPSLLTGRLPDSHGLTNKRATLPESELTLAEMLQGVGYRTLAAVSNLNGGPTFNLQQGFDFMVELYWPLEGRSVDVVDPRSGDEYHFPRANEFPPLVRQWLATSARRDGDAPLFLYLHVLEPHNPYQPPPEYASLFLDPAYEGPFKDGSTEVLVENRHGKLEADAADRAASRALYDANLRWADHNVGGILDELRAAGLYDDALIFVTSDHGEAFWQHGMWGHNDQLYEEMVHIPLIVKLPAAAQAEFGAGLRPKGLVSLTDLTPSVAQWLDLPAPAAGFDGKPLTSHLFAPDATPERELYLRSHHRIPHVGLRTAEYKTILAREKDTGETKSVESYWLAKDPGETTNLVESNPKAAKREVSQLEEWIRASTVDRAERDIPLTMKEQQMLEALGYVGED